MLVNKTLTFLDESESVESLALWSQTILGILIFFNIQFFFYLIFSSFLLKNILFYAWITFLKYWDFSIFYVKRSKMNSSLT